MSRNNGDIVPFLKRKDYIMVNNKLGSGALGETVLLKDPFIDMLLVAKKYKPECEEYRERFYKNFLDEIKIMYNLNHPNIIRIYSYYPYEEIQTGFILMEYIDGKPIDENLDVEIIFETNYLDNVFLQLIEAFICLEKNNIVHRDIRPSNILIAKSSPPVVKLIDFGLGKIHKTVSIPKHDSLVKVINRGHVNAIPDEYYTEEYDILTDMYYLGDLFFTLLAKLGDADRATFSYSHVIEKMRKKNKVERYNSFLEIKEELSSKQLYKLSFTDEEKEIYRNFTDTVVSIIATIEGNQEFEKNVEKFLEHMQKMLSLNRFEDVIIKPNIGELFIYGNYTHYSKRKMPTSYLQDFYDWFSSLEKSAQQIVFDNLINKFSSIPVETDVETPF